MIEPPFFCRYYVQIAQEVHYCFRREELVCRIGKGIALSKGEQGGYQWALLFPICPWAIV